MHVAFRLGIFNSYCEIAFMPLSWRVFIQPCDGRSPTNVGFGPFRITFN